MKKTIRFLVPLLLALMILGSIVWYLFDYDRTFTRDTLLSQARYNDLHGNSRLSSWFYNMAYGFSGHDENVAVELANQYKARGNFTKAEYTLTSAINNDASAELYENLCKTYVQQDKLLDAVRMLDNVTDPTIRASLDADRPTAPAPDYSAGYYSKYMDIHLTSSPNTTIYYTTNGEYPSVKGEVYNGSISLPAGETTIYAISVDKQGLVSPITVLGYTITGVIEKVTFMDPTMESAIREAIGIGAEKAVYTNDLWNITEFTVPDGVKNYEDLGKMPYLAKLSILDQRMSTLTPLSALTSLTELDLSGCSFPVEDMPILAALPSLTHLTMANCGLSTIAGLAGTQKLTYLDLNNNTVRNLDVLESMTGLTELYLQHNAVRELNSLAPLSNLTRLNISYNAVPSLSPLRSNAKLTWLEADNNQLTTLDGVNPGILHLSANSNSLTGVNTLAGCTELRDLSIASNQIADISSLNTLTKLENFNFSSNHVEALPAWPEGTTLKTIDGSYNQLTSIDELEGMDELTHVYMDYNLLTEIDALAENFCLVQVNVFGNEIEDVSALREHDIIVNYDPT